MKVIFTHEVKGVASKGDLKNVREGFFRNFLMPRKLAVHATESLMKHWDDVRKKMLIEKEQIKSQLEETNRRLGGAKIRIEKKITKKGTLYGGVKAEDIAAAIKSQCSLEIPLEAIVLKQAIKAVGSFDIVVNLGAGVETALPIEVVGKE